MHSVCVCVLKEPNTKAVGDCFHLHSGTSDSRPIGAISNKVFCVTAGTIVLQLYKLVIRGVPSPMFINHRF